MGKSFTAYHLSPSLHPHAALSATMVQTVRFGETNVHFFAEQTALSASAGAAPTASEAAAAAAAAASATSDLLIRRS